MTRKNVRKLLCGVLLTVLMFCVVGCGAKENPPADGRTDAVEEMVDEAVDSKVDYTAFTGEFMDSFSQRASATVTENPDEESVTIMVCWANSVDEYIRWTMTATFEEEDRLVYSDCLTECIRTDAEGNDSVEVRSRDGKGYFEWNCQNGALSWTGAEDESCRQCVFEKMPTE